MSKVTLISDKEVNEFVVGETKFLYRRVTAGDWAMISKKHTVRGVVDMQAAGMELLKRYLLNWTNLQDIDGNDVPFNPEIIPFIPDAVLADLVSQINKAEVQLAEKNSQPTPKR